MIKLSSARKSIFHLFFPHHHVQTNTLTLHFCHVRVQNARPLGIQRILVSLHRKDCTLSKNGQDLNVFFVKEITVCKETSRMRNLPLIQSRGQPTVAPVCATPLSHHRPLRTSQQPLIWSCLALHSDGPCQTQNFSRSPNSSTLCPGVQYLRAVRLNIWSQIPRRAPVSRSYWDTGTQRGAFVLYPGVQYST